MRLAVLRPEPGNAQSCARARAAGFDPIALPLFEVAPRAWQPPPGPFDALLLTSANAARHAGTLPPALAALPVLAVGAATAAAARAIGLAVAFTGEGDAAQLLAAPHGFTRLLHLAGAEPSVAPGGPVAAQVTVYANRPRAVAPAAVRALAGSTALLHAPSAARRLAALAEAAGLARGSVAIAALSPAVAAAAGAGWRACAVAAAPQEAALFAAAGTLAPAS